MAVINTALLSFGMSGRVFHAPLLQYHPGFNLAACWERREKVINQFYPAVKSYSALEDLLHDATIDLVVVNTPTATHFDFVAKALRKGKHVVVEKAFAGNAEGAIELRSLAKAKRCKLAVFQNRRWDSDFLSVRNILQQGLLGEVVEANLAFSRYNPELSPKQHKEVPSSGAGIVKDLGPHVIDQALLLFGMPQAVFADIGITRNNSQVDDYFDILMRYANKRVHVRGGYFYKQPVAEYTLFGKLGSFSKSRSDVQEAQLDQGMTPGDDDYGREPDSAAGKLCIGPPGQAGVRDIVSPRGNYLRFYDGLHESITRNLRAPVTASDGVRVMQIIDAAFLSHDEGRLVGL